MSPQPRAEPRWMSLADLMVAVAGCAVGLLGAEPFSLGWVDVDDAYLGAGSFHYDSIFWDRPPATPHPSCVRGCGRHPGSPGPLW